MSEPLLEVDALVTELSTLHGRFNALDGVSFAVPSQKTLGLVGESGCGKSLTALSILKLLPSGVARITGGQIRFHGQDLARASDRALRAVRGHRISMIFQEPMTSLNPVFTVGEQIAEVVRLHLGRSRGQARAHAVEMLRQVGIAAPEARAAQFPHQLSGGMRQRVMIAMALACGPELLIADEPTTALDVTIQAQILELMGALQRERKMSMLLITHDLGLVSMYADAVAVMYAGKVVERAPTAEIFASPQHPYTQGLLRSRPGAQAHPGKRAPLPTIAGTVPSPWNWPSGCRFRDRCPRATAICAAEVPPLLGDAHAVACHHPGAPASAEATS